jgi:predicted PP-loop superfamily ATPase
MAFHAKLSRLFGDKSYKKEQSDSMHVKASGNEDSSAEACIASISQDGLRNRRHSIALDDTAESELTKS